MLRVVTHAQQLIFIIKHIFIQMLWKLIVKKSCISQMLKQNEHFAAKKCKAIATKQFYFSLHTS